MTVENWHVWTKSICQTSLPDFTILVTCLFFDVKRNPCISHLYQETSGRIRIQRWCLCTETIALLGKLILATQPCNKEQWMFYMSFSFCVGWYKLSEKDRRPTASILCFCLHKSASCPCQADSLLLPSIRNSQQNVRYGDGT